MEPTVALVVNAGLLEFTVDYVVDYTKRTALKDRLFTKIVQEVANSNGRFEWATSGATITSQPATPDVTEAYPSPSIRSAGHAAGSH